MPKIMEKKELIALAVAQFFKKKYNFFFVVYRKDIFLSNLNFNK